MIKLFDNYIINGDSYQYIFGTLENRYDKNLDKNIEFVKPIGYYTSLKSAFDAAFKMKCRKAISKTDYSLKDAIEEIKTIREDFTKLLTDSIKEDM